MSLLSYFELFDLVRSGVINAPLKNINGSSIDLTLHHIIRKEVIGSALKTVRLYKGESIATEEIDMRDGLDEYVLMPDAVVLGSTVERFNLPLNISAEFSLKSTLGRNFMEHMLAGWVDPGFSGTLTLELKNGNQFHRLAIAPGQKIGQVKFFRHESVPSENSYEVKGQYMHQDKVTAAKGIR